MAHKTALMSFGFMSEFVRLGGFEGDMDVKRFALCFFGRISAKDCHYSYLRNFWPLFRVSASAKNENDFDSQQIG